MRGGTNGAVHWAIIAGLTAIQRVYFQAKAKWARKVPSWKSCLLAESQVSSSNCWTNKILPAAVEKALHWRPLRKRVSRVLCSVCLRSFDILGQRVCEVVVRFVHTLRQKWLQWFVFSMTGYDVNVCQNTWVSPRKRCEKLGPCDVCWSYCLFCSHSHQVQQEEPSWAQIIRERAQCAWKSHVKAKRQNAVRTERAAVLQRGETFHLKIVLFFVYIFIFIYLTPVNWFEQKRTHFFHFKLRSKRKWFSFQECLQRLFSFCGNVQNVIFHKKPSAAEPDKPTDSHFDKTAEITVSPLQTFLLWQIPWWNNRTPQLQFLGRARL